MTEDSRLIMSESMKPGNLIGDVIAAMTVEMTWLIWENVESERALERSVD